MKLGGSSAGHRVARSYGGLRPHGETQVRRGESVIRWGVPGDQGTGVNYGVGDEEVERG